MKSKIKMLINYFALVVIALSVLPAYAATQVINAKIINVAPDADYNVVYVSLDKPHSGTVPTCVDADKTNSYQISELNTDISKALISVALTAMTTGKSVKVVGQNVCTGRPGIEKIRLISFE